jgi:hypothetical protein
MTSVMRADLGVEAPVAEFQEAAGSKGSRAEAVLSKFRRVRDAMKRNDITGNQRRNPWRVALPFGTSAKPGRVRSRPIH